MESHQPPDANAGAGVIPEIKSKKYCAIVRGKALNFILQQNRAP
jgi:hypothetical protein